MPDHISRGALGSLRHRALDSEYHLNRADTLLTWVGSDTGPPSLNCARDLEIPIDVPAAFFEQLLLREPALNALRVMQRDGALAMTLGAMVQHEEIEFRRRTAATTERPWMIS